MRKASRKRDILRGKLNHQGLVRLSQTMKRNASQDRAKAQRKRETHETARISGWLAQRPKMVAGAPEKGHNRDLVTLDGDRRSLSQSNGGINFEGL